MDKLPSFCFSFYPPLHLITILQVELLLPPLLPDHLLASPAVTDLSSPLAGSLGLSHSAAVTANYLSGSPSTEKKGGVVKEEERGGTKQHEEACTCFPQLATQQSLSPGLFSSSTFQTHLFIIHMQRMKTNTPLLPRSFLRINFVFVSPQQGRNSLSRKHLGQL